MAKFVCQICEETWWTNAEHFMKIPWLFSNSEMPKNLSQQMDPNVCKNGTLMYIRGPFVATTF